MNLTRESEYALKGLARLTMHPPGTMVPLAEIAAEEQLPSSFLAKIFQKLARHGLLEADRGRGSGYTLRNPSSDIRVRDILEAIEGPMALKRCLLWTVHCNDRAPCPLHYRLERFHSQFEEVLNEITLAEYVEESFDGKSSTSQESGATG